MVFDNADGSLVPGLYARIRLGGGAHAATRCWSTNGPSATDQNKRFVLVLEEGNRTAYREVLLGAYVGPRVIENGLHAGERIVVNGLQRVRPA